MPEPVRIGLVAGEASGDQLGAPLIAELKKLFPQAEFAGIGGDKMIDQGITSLFPMERLSVMGFIDPLKRLPELLKIRKELYRHFLENKFSLVVGIDAPDFNLGLELKLRKKGLATAHYVSPSVWAWRQGRVKKIARAVDHMLTLFPFEADFYRDYHVPVTFVGHPLADQFPEQPNTLGARRSLDVPSEAVIIALMPGSRISEINLMGELFFQVAERCTSQLDNVLFLIPSANPACHDLLQSLASQFSHLPLRVINGRSHQVLEAADAVLMTSGTTTLETMLMKKPMVVTYRMGNFSYQLASRLVKTPYISLPNLLAKRELVPEFIQDQATVENIAPALLGLLQDQQNREQLIVEFNRLHRELRQNNAVVAANTLAGLINA